MRTGYLHDGVVDLAPAGDAAAVGAAVTVALCGAWQHEPPCPIAPHNTAAIPLGEGRVAVRVLFACEPSDEGRARKLIESALRSGRQKDPDGVPSSWRCLSSGPGAVQPSDEELLGRLARG
jgi:hypothetical protein